MLWQIYQFYKPFKWKGEKNNSLVHPQTSKSALKIHFLHQEVIGFMIYEYFYL